MHMNRHTGIGPLQCPGCAKRYMTPLELGFHKRSCNHLVEKEFLCEECGKRFQTKTHLVFHSKIHLPPEDKPFKCQFCTRTFAYNHDCIHHMRLHIGEKPFKCTQCDKAFHRKSYLTEHMFVHTGVSRYQCDTCQEYFKTQQMLQTHVKNVHILKKASKTRKSKDSKSTNNTNNKNKSNTKAKYRCEECDMDFKFIKEFHFHCAVNHKENIIKNGNNKPKTETSNDQTDTTTTTSNNSTSKPSNNGEEVLTDFEPTMIYKCRHCDKTFKWLSVLKKHADTHKEKLNNDNKKGGGGVVVAVEQETEAEDSTTNQTTAEAAEDNTTDNDKLHEVVTSSTNNSLQTAISDNALDNNVTVNVTAMDIDEDTTTTTTTNHQLIGSSSDGSRGGDVKTSYVDSSNVSIVTALLQQRGSASTTVGGAASTTDTVESVILERLNAVTAGVNAGGQQLSFHSHNQGQVSGEGSSIADSSVVTAVESTTSPVAESPAIVCYVTDKGEVLTTTSTADHGGVDGETTVNVSEELNILACGHCLAGFTDEGELNRHVITEHSDLIGIDSVEQQELLLRQQLAATTTTASVSASPHGASELTSLASVAEKIVSEMVTASEVVDIDQQQQHVQHHVTANEFSTTSEAGVITTSVDGTTGNAQQLLTQQHVTVETEDGTAIHVLDGTEGIKIIQLAMEAKQELEALERQEQQQ